MRQRGGPEARSDAERLVARLVSRHLPGVTIRPITRLGEGLDNVAWDVNGDFILRFGKEVNPGRQGETVVREATLLRRVSRSSPLPVPQPIFVDPEAGVIALTRLHGVPLFSPPAPRHAGFASTLGAFLDAMHRLPVEEMGTLVAADAGPLQAWLDEAAEGYRSIESHVPAGLRSLVEDFLGRTPPPEPDRLVFCHNDLGSEHILVDEDTATITGIIDWTDAAIVDRARDFALAHRDFGTAFLDGMLSRYSLPFERADRARTIFYSRCKLIEDIAYGLEGGDPRYATAGLANLARTFGVNAGC